MNFMQRKILLRLGSMVLGHNPPRHEPSDKRIEESQNAIGNRVKDIKSEVTNFVFYLHCMKAKLGPQTITVKSFEVN